MPDWFGKLCRNVGLTIHHTVKPLKDEREQNKQGSTEESNVKEISRSVEEKQDGKVILRRTTIEEIEYKPDQIDEQRKNEA